MKAFGFEHHLIDAYARQYDAGRFWPDALLSLNPRYLQGRQLMTWSFRAIFDEATGRLFRFGVIPIRSIASSPSPLPRLEQARVVFAWTIVLVMILFALQFIVSAIEHRALGWRAA